MDKWEKRSLGELLDIERGGSPRPIKNYLTEDADGVNWIKISDATSSNKYIYSTIQKIKKEGLSKTRLVKEGDFILSNSMSYGRPYIMKTTGAIHDGWLLLKEKEEKFFNKEFLYYLLSSSYIINQFGSLAAGTTVKNLNIKLVSQVKVPVFPLSEQDRLVSKLDALFAKVDESLALIDQNIAQAEALKLSVLDEELNTDSEEVKISNLLVNTKNINPKEIYKDEEFTYIDISSINKDLYRIESPKILKGSEAPSRARKEVKLRDIVFATTRPNLKNVAIVDKEYTNSIASTGFCVLRPKQDKLINSFLFYFLISNKLQDLIQPFIRGAQYPAISDRNLKGIKLATPTIETQQKIVQKLDALFAEIDALVLDYTQKRENLEALKSSLLDQAFKGEL